MQWRPAPSVALDIAALAADCPTGITTNLFNFIIIEKGQWCPAPPVALDIAALAADYPTGINTYLYNFYYHLHQQTTTKQTIKYNAMYELLIAIHVLHLLS